MAHRVIASETVNEHVTIELRQSRISVEIEWSWSCTRCGATAVLDDVTEVVDGARDHLCNAGDVVAYQTEIEADRRADRQADDR